MSGDVSVRDVIASALFDLARAQDPEQVSDYHPEADAVLAGLGGAGWELKRKPDPLLDVRDDDGNYISKQGSTHEHRTVGDYRSWSHDAHEWCYPSDPCHLCKEMANA